MKSRACKAIILPKDHLKKKDEIVYDLEEDLIPPHTLNLPDSLQNRLFEHQKVGVDWLFRANRELSGGILGDDMGLGKTFQVACLLCGLFRGKEIQRVLIVSPVSVIQSWSREINDHITPFVSHIGVHLITSDLTKNKREKLLRSHSHHPSLMSSQ
jgi:SNF2 family DNA or RNA helicase